MTWHINDDARSVEPGGLGALRVHTKEEIDARLAEIEEHGPQNVHPWIAKLERTQRKEFT